jgi:hypothetical protein
VPLRLTSALTPCSLERHRHDRPGEYLVDEPVLPRASACPPIGGDDRGIDRTAEPLLGPVGGGVGRPAVQPPAGDDNEDIKVPPSSSAMICSGPNARSMTSASASTNGPLPAHTSPTQHAAGQQPSLLQPANLIDNATGARPSPAGPTRSE